MAEQVYEDEEVMPWAEDVNGLNIICSDLTLLGFKCTWYEIKSRDMNEKGKDLIFYNKPYMPLAGLHGPLHVGVCTQSVTAPTPAQDVHAHTLWYCLLLLSQRGGGMHVLKYILLIHFEWLTY